LIKEFENLRVSGILPFGRPFSKKYFAELYIPAKIANYEVIIQK
jgi:hypothetical protein